MHEHAETQPTAGSPSAAVPSLQPTTPARAAFSPDGGSDPGRPDPSPPGVDSRPKQNGRSRGRRPGRGVWRIAWVGYLLVLHGLVVLTFADPVAVERVK